MLRNKKTQLFFDDYPDAFIPQIWALEAIATLNEQMIYGSLVYRDFDPAIANYGEVINVNKPGSFKAKRKSAADNVTVQQQTVETIDVRLNQHLHTSFIIKDSDYSKSREDLFATYLQPAVVSIARAIDQIIANQVHQFYSHSGGHLQKMDDTNGDDYLLEVREVLNNSKVPDADRRGVITNRAETNLLKQDKFVNASLIGDNGTALRNASLGRIYGFDIVREFNQPEVTGGLTTVNGAVNNVAGYGVGVTSLTVDGLSAAITAGTFLTVAGDDTPQLVVSTTGGATPTAIVITPGLKHAVVDDAIIYLQPKGTVNFTAGYLAKYSNSVCFDSMGWTPRVGQAVTFGTDLTNIYGIIDLEDSTHFLLDRPLEAAVADGVAINFGPAGGYSLFFQRDAIALVNRPLAPPMPGTGARSAVMNFASISMRVVFTYNGTQQGTLCTVDTLCGVKVIDDNKGAVLFS